MEACGGDQFFGRANGSVTQLRGQGPRAEVAAARWLPRIPLDSDTRSATSVTPRRLGSAQGLQPRTEAGPRQLQWQVGRRRPLSSRAAHWHALTCMSHYPQ